MYKPVIVVALVLACVFSCNGVSPVLKMVVDECKAQYNIESSQIKEAIENKKLPVSENGQCFMSCVMEKLGVLKDGKIDLDRVMEINKLKFKEPENLEKANEVAKRCANVQATDGKPCSIAVEATKCAKKNAEEMGLQMPPI